MSDFNPDGGGDYKSPPASVDDKPWGPFSKRKAPLDEQHTCPMCEGKGFVNVVHERGMTKGKFGVIKLEDEK